MIQCNISNMYTYLPYNKNQLSQIFTIGKRCSEITIRHFTTNGATDTSATDWSPMMMMNLYDIIMQQTFISKIFKRAVIPYVGSQKMRRADLEIKHHKRITQGSLSSLHTYIYVRRDIKVHVRIEWIGHLSKATDTRIRNGWSPQARSINTSECAMRFVSKQRHAATGRDK